jgi:glycosyltransferase involved in cell wall biosynthesis
VTEPDRAVLRDAGVATPIAVVPNVHPAHTGAVRAFGDRRDLLFVGNFVHAPNVDAVRWFCAEVLPAVRARIPDVRLFVVGNGPPPSVQALACPHVTVTGWVESTEPHLDACRVSVAPLRYGAGMKGKIGEALARGLPVVSTGIGAEGMDLRDGVHALIADDPRAFAEAIVRLYRDEALWTALSAAGRRHVDERYGPATVGAALEALLRAPLTRAGAAA